MPDAAPAATPFVAEEYAYADVRAVAEAIGVSDPVAVTLVRRGYRTPELARRFLAADEAHPPAAFPSMEEAVELVVMAIEAGSRITVHGDFDVDGVSATALLVGALRGLGADCDWLIPDRIADGYGLSGANVERLAQRGTELLITADCGITAVAEVALAQELGMEVLVTDHHQRAEELPACTILHPAVDGYPFEHLCGTAVAWKLATALRSGEEADLDLVALATVADMVPLVGENRALVKRGLASMRLAQRAGLRALITASKCEPTTLDESDLGFRLAPRINAAGRLYRADAGVELMLTDDEARAQQIAEELSRANSERRATERDVDAAAESALRELPEELQKAPGLVVAGEGWHPGVVGIVASRLVERHNRPVVVVSLDGEGGGRGSGRSIPGFDLLAALRACGEHLESFGGHRAAAGVSLRAERVDSFRAAFAAHAISVLGPEPPPRSERFDALVGGVGLGLDLAEELRQLAPFGLGNPGVRLVVPSARVSDVRTMGEGKHARFSLHSGSHRALGVAFGRSDLGVEAEEPVDAAVRLEVNHWNGSVEPRVVLRELYPLDAEGTEAPPLHRCECDDAEWWARFEAELVAEPGGAPGSAAARRERSGRVMVQSGSSAVVAIAELVSSGAGVLAICADASRRAGLAAGAAGLARFNGGSGRVACGRCGAPALAGLLAKAEGGLALTDYAALLAAGECGVEAVARFEHVALVDPPTSAAATALAGLGDRGYLHQLHSEAEHEFALAVLEESLASRDAVAGVFRSLRAACAAAAPGAEAAEVSGAALRAALAGAGAHPLAPEAAARAFRVLGELDLVQGAPEHGEGLVCVVSSKGTDLERSAAFRAYRDRHLEAQQFLARPKQL
ncbi:MAG: single-stranded-DNA-specific exonuclease RecJ [Actinobacteria bacterium]|nr:single-stranded-DNA-specific exonuclease RecJ [Actinomycetota bacterium]